MLTRRTLLATTAVLAAPAVHAQVPVEIQVGYQSAIANKDLLEGIGALYESRTPGVKVTLRAAEEDYESLLQRHLRDSITRSLPDVAFHGLNRQRTLLERDIPVDLRPFLDADPETPTLGFSPALLSLGQVGGKQTGIGFELSTAVFYYNMGLVRRAGGDTETLPRTWDELVKLAAAIDALGGGVRGLFFDWTITGNWSWQSLVFSHGGAMMAADESRIAFGEAPGRAAMAVLRRMVDQGNMPDLRPQAAMGDFFAGRLGISMQSTAQLGRYNREIGGRFPLRTGRFPIAVEGGRLPAGGNVGMMFTRDPAKQKAAWDFIKLACGPEGATRMVKATGYFAGTTVPATRDDMLGAFYRDNPNHRTAIEQQDVLTAWYAFPGQNALKITDVINDGLQSVVAKQKTADAALGGMVAEVQGLLPRRRS